MIEKSRVVEILEEAFRPLDCVAELKNWENGVGFRIYEQTGKPVITREFESVDGLRRNRSQLIEVIVDARERLSAMGHLLDPWSMPAYTDFD